MNLYIWKYDGEKFQKTLVIDYASSIIWVRRFQNAGEFELYLPADAELLNLFINYETLITRDDTDTSMITERVELTTNDEEGDHLIISGCSSEGLLGRRVVRPMFSYSGTTEIFIRRLVGLNIIQPQSKWRGCSLIRLAEMHNYEETISKQITGKNLLDSVSDVCTTYSYGFKMTFDGEYFIFDIYKGTDRSMNQMENSFVVFSPDFENLGSTSYILDRTTACNVVTVAGEGEGKDRVIVTSSENILGIDGFTLREKWVDARNVSSNTDDGEISEEDYREILYQQAIEERENSRETREYSGEILNTDMYQFGKDYNLGDKVSIVNQYGIWGTAVVTEITEVEDAEGYRLIPTFSEWEVD